MIKAILERLLFGALLICFLQVPILSDHYIQYLNGYLTANQDQVDQLNRLAAANRFDSAHALIESLSRNSDTVVRQDASNKMLMLEQNIQLKEDLSQLKEGNYFQRLLFFLDPTQFGKLGKVLVNFKPGIPLSVSDLLASVALALSFSLLIKLPFRRRSKYNLGHDTAS